MRRLPACLLACAALARAVGAQEQSPPAPHGPDPHGTVVFSRSADTPAQAEQGSAPAAPAAHVTDAMRAAPAFTEYALTVHLEPATASLEAEARLTVRNAGAEPLRVLPLQLSAGLRFTQVRVDGKPLRFTAQTIQSDADHTGALTEAAVELPTPLAPGAALALTVEYAGKVEAASGRLERARASAAFARSSDWDQISDEFTALRGFGNTVWYPVASIPALLGGEGALARETERQRARNADATVRMEVTLEFTGHAPNTLAVDGAEVAAPEPVSLPTATFPGVLRFSVAPARLGAQALSLVAAARDVVATSPLVSVAAMPAHLEAANAYASGANLLEPLVHDWFGGPPKASLLLVDVPVEDALPFDDGGALLLSLDADAQPSQVAPGLVTPLAHTYFRSPRPWLRAGVAGLMELLWTERTEGRAKALAQLGESRAGLALREPATPGAGGEPLLTAPNTAFLQTKATYVLWMLRALVGEDALRAALRTYDPARDTTPDYFEKLLAGGPAGPAPRQEDATGFVTDAHKSPAQANTGSAGDAVDLHAFFQNWVNADPGLPDLAIVNVAPSHSGSGGQWLVAVEVANTGYADAWTPLTVHSAETAETVLLHVPARGSVSRRVLLPDEPTEVDLNDGSVPEAQAGAHRRLLTAAAPATPFPH